VTSGFRHSVNEIFTLLRCYAAWIGSCRRFKITSRPHLLRSSIPFFLDSLTLKMGSTPRPTASVTKYQCMLCNIPEERRSRLDYSSHFLNVFLSYSTIQHCKRTNIYLFLIRDTFRQTISVIIRRSYNNRKVK